MQQRRIRRPSVAIGAGAVLAALLVPLAPPAAAQVVAQSTIVSDNPAAFTPNVLDGKVNAFAQVGNTIVAAGSFTQVQASSGGATLTRQNIVAFNATTGAISTFAATVSGEVYDLEPAGDGTSVYVVGSFTSVNGTSSSRVARLDVSSGAKVSGFTAPSTNGTVKNVDLVGGRLLIGGSFTSVGGQSRSALASLDPTSGAVTPFLSLAFSGPQNGGGTQVLKMAVTPNGNRLVVIGNFTVVNSQSRMQIAMIDLSGGTATLASWATNFYTNTCNPVFDTYMRDVDFSPDSSFFVVTVTGAYGGPDSPCDVIARWETYGVGLDQSATWRDYTGGDTSYAVAITSAAVYVGGHMRWLNNPDAGDAAGPGAVPREGIAALDPVSGLPLSWNPGRARGVGVFDLMVTQAGLWAGSDTDRIGGETHRKIAFFPLAGGTVPPAEKLGTVPNDVYLLGQASSSASSDVFWRINTGGPALQSADDGPDWTSDSDARAYADGDINAAGWGPVPVLNASVPKVAGDRAPAALFSSEAWGSGTGAAEMGWHLPVPADQAVTVRLYLSNRCDCTNVTGSRVFDVAIDGTTRLNDWDLVARYGDQVGAMESFDIVSDGVVDIDFTHVTENPLINGIEIIRTGSGGGGGGGLGAADTVQRRYFTGSTVGATSTLTPTVAWSLDRGSFLVDGFVYTGWADGTFSRRTFNGTTFGSPTTVPMYGGSFGSEVSNLTGIAYANGRIYYTLFGDDRLLWRWFSPQSQVVGATAFEVGGDVGDLAPARVQGLFLSGSSLFAADRATGDLMKVTLSGTTVSGPADVVEASLDWRARGMFLWNGTPAPAANVNPVAVATGECPPVGLTCSFDSEDSTDSDGVVTSRSWAFQDGGTSNAVAPQHQFPGGGDFTATLTVTDDRGGTSSVTISVTVVAPDNLPPTAAFSTSCEALVCSFNSAPSSDSDGTIAARAWEIDGVPAGTGSTLNKTFGAAGTYSVSLTVTDDDGDTGTVVHDVLVTEAPPSSIAYRGSATANVNQASVAVPTPPGTQAGDALLLFVTSAKGTTPATAPSGWTVVGSRPDGTDMRTTLYQRTAAGGSLGTVGWSVATKTNLTVLAYSGAVALPAAFGSSAKTTAASTSYTAPAVAVADAGSVVVSFWALRGGSVATWTAASGTVERADSSGTGTGLVSGSAADQLGAGVGAGTARTATATVSSAKATGWTVVLEPL